MAMGKIAPGTVRASASRRRKGRFALATASIAACLVMLLAAAGAGAEIPAVQSEQWKVIVHPRNPLRSIGREELERIYRRRSRFWKDGSEILPLNLPGGDALRRRFSEEILCDDEESLATFWNREYFQGIAPPTVLQSSKAVRAYVAATPNAIGYVPAEDVDDSVAVVEVRRGN